MPLPLKPIYVEPLFQQRGLYFIGEIHHASLGQHQWILTITDYFTKWIEVVPTRQAIDSVIIHFLENNILSRFGCPMKIITDNAQDFNSKELISFFNQYHITLGHPTKKISTSNAMTFCFLAKPSL